MATRILYVITKAAWGGAQRYVYDLAVAAHSQGYDVAVAVGGKGPLIEELAKAHIRIVPLPLSQHTHVVFDVLTFGPLFSLIRLLHQERPDIVHVNSAKAGGLGALAARIAGVPRIIFTAHGWEFNAPRPLLSRVSILFFSWLTMVLAHTVICVSRAIQRDVRWLPLITHKLHVIHNGITPVRHMPQSEARSRLSPSLAASTWIGMISELHPTKRIEDAIHAFAILAHSNSEAALVILGEGPERARLESLIRELGLQKRVKLIGHIPHAAEYVRAFTLFIHSSQSEALGFAILEAGSASLPVVATCVGGIPEIIIDESYGLLVPPRHPEALAASMKVLIERPEHAQELGRNLHDRILSEFSKEKMLSATFPLYR